MKALKRCTALLSISVLCLASFAASASASSSVFSTTGPSAPISPEAGLQIRSSNNLALNAGSNGTITCAHPWGLIGNTQVVNPEVTEQPKTVTRVSSLFFGNNLSPTATESKFCSTTSPVPACRLTLQQPAGGLSIEAQESSASGKRIATLLVGSAASPLTLKMTCRNTSGEEFSSFYKTAYRKPDGHLATTPAKLTASFGTTSPLKAADFSFIDTEIWYQCGIEEKHQGCSNYLFPNFKLEGTIRLYSSSSAAPGNQVFLWSK